MMRNRTVASATVLPLAVLLASAPCLAQKYSVVTLPPPPGGSNVSAADMNNAGVVVGNAIDANGNTQAVEWIGTTPTQLVYNSYPGSTSGAVAINNQNVVIGNTRDSESGIFEIGPSVDAGASLDLGIGITAISDSNVVVGQMEGHPVIWVGEDVSQRFNGRLPNTPNNEGSYTDGSGINSAGVIVGTEYDDLPDYSDTYPIAVRWKPDPKTGAIGSSVQALSGLGGRDSSAISVNATGSIVGWATLGNKRTHAVLWGPHTGAFDLGTLGGNESSAGAINAQGDVAGQAQNAYGQWHATLWTHKHYKAVDLNLDIDTSLAKQITLTSASTTNDRCQVLANGVVKKTGAQAAFVLSLTDQSECNQP